MQDRQNVRKGQFRLQGETEDVALRERCSGFQCGERKFFLTQKRQEILTREEHTFDLDSLQVIAKAVEDLGAEMGHPHLVHVGEYKARPQDYISGILVDRVDLLTEVPGRFFHLPE